MNLAIAFGHVVRKWRISRKISQGQLAKESDLDRTFISLLERGQRQPSLQTIFAISTVLKVSADELIRQTERKAKFSDLNSRRVFLFSKRL